MYDSEEQELVIINDKNQQLRKRRQSFFYNNKIQSTDLQINRIERPKCRRQLFLSSLENDSVSSKDLGKTKKEPENIFTKLFFYFFY